MKEKLQKIDYKILVLIILILTGTILTLTFISLADTGTEKTFEYTDINDSLDEEYYKYLTEESTTNVNYSNIFFNSKGELVYKVLNNPHKGLVYYTGRSYGYSLNNKRYNNGALKKISTNGYSRMYWNDVVTGIDENGNIQVDWRLVDNAIKSAVENNVKMNFRAFATYGPYVKQYTNGKFTDSCTLNTTDNQSYYTCNTANDTETYVVPESIVNYCNSKTTEKYPNPASNKPEQLSCGNLVEYYSWNDGKFYKQWIPNYKNEIFSGLSTQLIKKFTEHLSTTTLEQLGFSGNSKVLGDYVEFVDVGTYGIYGEQHLGFGYNYMNNTAIKNYRKQNNTNPTSDEIKSFSQKSNLSDLKEYTLTGGELYNNYIIPFETAFSTYNNLDHIIIYNSYVNNLYNLDTTSLNYDDYKFYIYGKTGKPESDTTLHAYDKVMDKYERISTRVDGFLVNNAEQKVTLNDAISFNKTKPILLEYVGTAHQANSLMTYMDKLITTTDNQNENNRLKMQKIYNEAKAGNLTYLEMIDYSITSSDEDSLKAFKYKLRDLEAYLGNHLGYYFKIKTAKYKDEINEGEDLDLKVNIVNEGMTRLYTSANLYAAILDQDNNVVALKKASENSNANTWESSKSVDVTVNNILSNKTLSPGIYKLGIGIIEDSSKTPSYLFGSKVEVTDDNWSILGQVTVGEVKHPSVKVVTPSKAVKSLSINSITVNEGLYPLSSENIYQYYLSSSATSLKDGSWNDYNKANLENIGKGLSSRKYLFTKIIKDTAGLDSSNTSNTVTIDGTKYNVFGPITFDNTAPTCTITKSTEELTNKDIILTITGQDNETAPSELEYSLDNGATFSSIRTITLKENKQFMASVRDEAGNIGTCEISVSNIDKELPKIVVEPNGTTLYSKTAKAEVTITDNNSIISKKYLWVQGESEPSNNEITTDIAENNIITKETGTGNNYYLWIKATDKAGNTTKIRTNAFMLDNTGPNVSITQTNNILIVQANDELVPLADQAYSWDNITYTSSNTKVIDKTGTYKVYVKDALGNISTSSITVENITITPPTISINEISKKPVQSHKVILSITNGTNGLDQTNKYEYYLSTSSTTLTGGEFKEYVNKKEFNIGTSLTGIRYLYVRQISDETGINSQSSGNVVTLDGKAYHQFGPYIFDNTNPECKIEKSITKITNKNITLKINGTDETSTNNLQYSLNGKDFDENKERIITTNNTYKAYVKDEAGNFGTCSTVVSNIDKESPKVTIVNNGTNNFRKSVKTKILVTDNNKVTSIKYLWKLGDDEPDNIDIKNSATNNLEISKNDGTGSYYLWVLTTDEAGNITKTKSNAFLLDNTPPTCTIINNNNKLTIEAFDSNSMLSSKPFSWDNKNYQESNTLEIGSEKEYEAFVKDNVGNIGSCKIAISTLVSVPNTKLIINRNLYIVGMLLIISGLGITTYMIIKKKKNV